MHFNEANNVALPPPVYELGGRIQLGWKMIICSITGCNRASEQTVIHHQLLSFVTEITCHPVSASEPSLGAII